MRLPVDQDGDSELSYQEIGARSPQFVTSQTPSSVSSTITYTSQFSPEPSISSTTTPTQASHDNTRAVKTIIQYFFLILALFIASILIFRRLFYLRKRDQRCREPYTHDQEGPSHSRRLFPRTTGLPSVNIPRGYPLFDSYLLALPSPAAYTSTRRTRADDIVSDGRRFMSTGAEVDHDGVLDDKDVLPKYETFGGPPKYVQSELDVEATLSAPVPLPPPPAAQSLPNGITLVEAPPNQTSRLGLIQGDDNSRSVPSTRRP